MSARVHRIDINLPISGHGRGAKATLDFGPGVHRGSRTLFISRPRVRCLDCDSHGEKELSTLASQLKMQGVRFEVRDRRIHDEHGHPVMKKPDREIDGILIYLERKTRPKRKKVKKPSKK